MDITKVYWCLGSNIDPQQHIAYAIGKFKESFSNISISNLYRCPAIGFIGDDFLNVVVIVNTDHSLERLQQFGNELEQAAGRVRTVRGSFDSRTLDVDLLMYGDLTGESGGREWPSTDIDKFAHVLQSLADIAAEDKHPISGKSFATLWQEYDQSKAQLTRLDDCW